jgi:putative methionine-R-sulfoxide reductase with GAF domain
LAFVCALEGCRAAKGIVTDDKNKPRLDEPTFAKLLEAAYVMQEHNREIRRGEASAKLQSGEVPSDDHSPPNGDYALILAEIVEAQHEIQLGDLECDQAMAMVAERIARITSASGAAIGIVEGNTMRYRAGAGAAALPLGTEVSLETAISAITVRTGQVLRTPDVNTETSFDPCLCRKRQILSLIAVPIYHDGNIVGALELFFDRMQGFDDQDIQSCQLMAGLVSEAIGRGAEWELKKSMAAERSAMLTAIERLKPNLSALAEDQTPEIATENDAVEASVVEASAVEASAVENEVCWKCGDALVEQEQFCGNCGASRAAASVQSSIQSKLASAMRMHSVHEHSSASGSEAPPQSAAAFAAEAEDRLAQLLASSGLQEEIPQEEQSNGSGTKEGGIRLQSSAAAHRGDNLEVGSVSAIESKPQDVNWSSASKARNFLEALTEPRSLASFGRLWRARRGDFYLAVAVILMFFVVRWGMLSGNSVGATGKGTAISAAANRRKPPNPNADLSLFDKFLISLGLADPPDAPPEYKGNPNTQVWIDPHTALYYCPDSDLYGKTTKGRFASQRDAQMDQFEPASRKACD